MQLKKGIYAEHEAEQFLAKSLPVAISLLTKKPEQALEFVKKQKLSYPVVLKLISKQALHKTDIGGVKIAKSEQELVAYYNELLAVAKKKKLKLDEKVEGILMQEFVDGKQLIVGIKKDAIFGHVIAFGLGGVFVEVMKDVTFRVCPIEEHDAQQMIDELKSSKILYGVRGDKPVTFKELKNILIKASKIAEKNPEISELDINPLIINDKFAKVVDARIRVE